MQTIRTWGLILLVMGALPSMLVAQTKRQAENSFFVKGQDLIFEFIKANKKMAKIIARENGAFAAELKRIKSKQL
ncbi:hypothetical protein VRU48_18135 [Pedobacter sp. KR3-3]|uniref:Uncharacterized protein n=1 Tax=Pedobacter albus TaxID=3113905 RepID=A0ABU7IC37_9SPHI|nr:hypothetical protein [Pedobacter sp. KR3-3]MEE1947050.1 hypothetical protein [Pedobacter sp. KR3-3]